MLKEHQYIFQRVNMGLDLALSVGAVFVAHFLRNLVVAPYLMPDILRHPTQLSDYGWVVWLLPVLVVAFLAQNGYYASQRVSSLRDSFKALALSAVEAAGVVAVIGFLAGGELLRKATVMEARADSTSRGVVLILPFVLVAVLGVKTVLVRWFLSDLRARGRNWRSMILVGSGETLRHFIGLVGKHPFWGFRIAGFIDDSGVEDAAVEGVRRLGTLDELIARLEAKPVDEVVFIPANRKLGELAPWFEACEEMGVRTRLSLNFFRHTIARPILESFEGYPLVTYSPTREMNWTLMFKYLFDRVAAAGLLLVLSPLFLLITLLVKGTSASWRHPVFYGQTRCGLNGKRFTLWKFRSMRIGADKELASLADQNEMQGPVFKMKEDPRITKVGKWLRKTSMDELPQLWNVLVGEMSLVGPRPPIPAEVAKYDRWQRRRLSMRPGITCLWQVMGRNELSFDVWMKLDLEYIDNWSLALDFWILLRTVYVVATGYGAM